jgi:hypothetical protein
MPKLVMAAMHLSEDPPIRLDLTDNITALQGPIFQNDQANPTHEPRDVSTIILTDQSQINVSRPLSPRGTICRCASTLSSSINSVIRKVPVAHFRVSKTSYCTKPS